MINPIRFVDYSRITDTLMFFDQYNTLNFTVNLTRKNKEGRTFFNHQEYMYYSEKLDGNAISVKRTIDCAFTIVSSLDKDNYLSIRPRDIYMLRYLMKDMVLPWFMGEKRIYKMDNNGILTIRGKFTPAEIPLSDFTFLRFEPSVITYPDGTTKEGVRMYINADDKFIDYDITKYMEFYYYIMNTDMYTAASLAINYLKTEPYGVNLKSIGDVKPNVSNNDNNSSGGKVGGFFD